MVSSVKVINILSLFKAVIDQAAETLKRIELENAQSRSVAGALTSDPKGLDHKVESLTVREYFLSFFFPFLGYLLRARNCY